MGRRRAVHAFLPADGLRVAVRFRGRAGAPDHAREDGQRDAELDRHLAEGGGGGVSPGDGEREDSLRSLSRVARSGERQRERRRPAGVLQREQHEVHAWRTARGEVSRRRPDAPPRVDRSERGRAAQALRGIEGRLQASCIRAHPAHPHQGRSVGNSGRRRSRAREGAGSRRAAPRGR